MSVEIFDCTLDESLYSFPKDVYRELQARNETGRIWTEEQFIDISGAMSSKIHQLLFINQEGNPLFQRLTAQIACIGSLHSSHLQSGLYQDIAVFLMKNEELYTQTLEGKVIPCGLGKSAGKFFKKHKTAIIIGIVVIAVIIVAAVIICSAGTGSSAVAGAVTSIGGAAGQALCNDSPAPTHRPPEKTDLVAPLLPETTQIDLTPLQNQAGSFDEDAVLRSYAIAQAEREAKEQRYPYLAVSADQIAAAEESHKLALNHFYEEVPALIQTSDIEDVITITADLIVAKEGAKSLSSSVFISAAADAGMRAHQVLSNKMESYEKFDELYQELAHTEKRLNELEQRNKIASLEKCYQESYIPNLEFFENEKGEFILIDTNNPARISIEVEVP